MKRAFCLLAAFVMLFAGCAGRPEIAPPHHVILISFDTTRPDHFGFYGNPWIGTPVMDALAAESIVFDNLLTAAPTTLASHTSIFTGTYPHTHGTARNGLMVNEDNATLPEILKEAGFHTAGFIGAFPLSERFGFAQGFDFFDETLEGPLPSTPELLNERPADKVTDAVTAYLDTTGIPDRLFLFAHYFDPHGPYRVRQPYHNQYRESGAVNQWLRFTQGADMRGKRAEKEKANRYASEVSFMDNHVGRLLDYLRDKGILDDAIVVVTSDHGQNFMEHYKNFNHGFTVYQTTVRGVGLIRLPGALHGGTRVPDLVSGIDILPTVLAILGLKNPARVEGEAIAVSREGVSVSPRVRFSQATKPFGEVEADVPWMNLRKARCIVSGDLKFIQTPYEDKEELYDLAADPFERRNLLETDPSMTGPAQDLRGRLLEWAESANPLPQPDSTTISEESIKRLKSLGYLQ